MVARVLEWSHSIPMEIWEQTTDPVDEYKVRVSEWLLHSNRDVYMLPETDNDSHTPLLVHLTVKQAEARAAQSGNCQGLS